MVKPSSFSGGWEGLISNGENFGFYLVGNQIDAHWSGGGYHHTTNTLSTGTWYHLAAVFTPSSGVQIYLNGVKILDQTDPSWQSIASKLVAGRGFSGVIDNVRV